MFRRKPARSIEIAKLSSLIAANVQINGDVVFTDGLRIDGRVDGNVLGQGDARGLLVLSAKGCINGAVRVYDAIVNGTISGDLEVEHFLELQANARVLGNISYRQLQMECGATIDGRLERMGDEQAAMEPAAGKVVALPVPPQAGPVRSEAAG